MSTVLVIEDDPDMREIERATLGNAGHEVKVAANGREGLEVLERVRPCVILLDEKRKRALAEDVPVLCVTAGGDEMTRHALDLGARECLHKPADFDELCDRVGHYCAEKRA